MWRCFHAMPFKLCKAGIFAEPLQAIAVHRGMKGRIADKLAILKNL